MCEITEQIVITAPAGRLTRSHDGSAALMMTETHLVASVRGTNYRLSHEAMALDGTDRLELTSVGELTEQRIAAEPGVIVENADARVSVGQNFIILNSGPCDWYFTHNLSYDGPGYYLGGGC